MAKRKGRMPTIWKVDDELWRLIKPNQLPKSLGSDRTAHRYFQRWVNNGVLQRIWKKMTKACDELGGVDWQWQSADGAMGKARFGGIKWAETQRIAAKTE